MKATKTTCILCGGDGYVSAETAHQYGRHLGDTTCPSCNGDGKVIDRPLPRGPHWTRCSDGMLITYDYNGWCITAVWSDGPKYGEYKVTLHADGKEYVAVGEEIDKAFGEVRQSHQADVAKKGEVTKSVVPVSSQCLAGIAADIEFLLGCLSPATREDMEPQELRRVAAIKGKATDLKKIAALYADADLEGDPLEPSVIPPTDDDHPLRLPRAK